MNGWMGNWLSERKCDRMDVCLGGWEKGYKIFRYEINGNLSLYKPVIRCTGEREDKSENIV